MISLAGQENKDLAICQENVLFYVHKLLIFWEEKTMINHAYHDYSTVLIIMKYLPHWIENRGMVNLLSVNLYETSH